MMRPPRFARPFADKRALQTEERRQRRTNGAEVRRRREATRHRRIGFEFMSGARFRATHDLDSDPSVSAGPLRGPPVEPWTWRHVAMNPVVLSVRAPLAQFLRL